MLFGAVAILMTACGSTPAEPPTTVPGSVPGTTPDAAPLLPPATGPVEPAGAMRFNTYWLRDCPAPEAATEIAGCRLAVGETRVTTEPDVARAAIDALLAGPDPVEIDHGLHSNIRPTAEVTRLVVEGDLATVDFNRYFETARTRPQAAQVVHTLTQLPGIARVQILVDGTPNGSIGARPLSRADIAEFTPMIFIESPALGATVASRLKVTGTVDGSIAAGAALGYRVEQPDGTSVVNGSSTVLSGTPGSRNLVLLPIELPAATAGPMTLVVFEPVASSTEERHAERIPIIVG